MEFLVCMLTWIEHKILNGISFFLLPSHLNLIDFFCFVNRDFSLKGSTCLYAGILIEYTAKNKVTNDELYKSNDLLKRS